MPLDESTSKGGLLSLADKWEGNPGISPSNARYFTSFLLSQITRMQDVASQTDSALQLGPGTLHGRLKRMLAARLIEESDERPDSTLDNKRRRYYRVKAPGKEAVRTEAPRIASALAAVKIKRIFTRGKA